MKYSLFVLLLSGCALQPQLDGQHGQVTCATVDTLTTRATTVYLQADKPGSIVVQPDCTIAITVLPKEVGNEK